MSNESCTVGVAWKPIASLRHRSIIYYFCHRRARTTLRPHPATSLRSTSTTPRLSQPAVVVVTQTPENLQYQHCHSYKPGLTIQEFWDITQVDWALRLQYNFGDAIWDESCRHVTQASRAQQPRLHQEGNNIWSGALTDEAATNYGTGWKTLVLMDCGVFHLFPVAAQAVRDASVPAVEVVFASMDPNLEIPTHSDSTDFVFTCHMGFEIPEPSTPTIARGQSMCVDGWISIRFTVLVAVSSPTNVFL
ncbi:hypothetical protein ACA910_003220 [Epithemia clementina (nom. ined.)]